MRFHAFALALACGYWLTLGSVDVHGQRALVIPRGPGAAGATHFNHGSQSFGIHTTRAVKPYANVERRPTVSPYLNLVRDDGDTSDVPNYQSLVRPQIEQSRTNRRQRQRLQKLGRQVRQLQTSKSPSTGETDQVRETGHAVRFMNLLHYYPR